jgi:hypothetical protein
LLDTSWAVWKPVRVAGLDLAQWLHQQCSEYRFDIGGVFRRDSEHASWPVKARNPAELEQRLSTGGHLLPLPKEPAALANVLEVSIIDFLTARVHMTPGLEVQQGSERGYPDLELAGAALGGGIYAVDIKAARRSDTNADRTQSRITLYTGNTYFRHPSLHWSGTLRPFGEYVGHLDVLMIYTLDLSLSARVRDLELIVQEPWRIASRERSSTTREYIGAVDKIEDLREGRGVFSTPEEFYRYWRRYNFRNSPQVIRQLERLRASQEAELQALRAERSTRTEPSA